LNWWPDSGFWSDRRAVLYYLFKLAVIAGVYFLLAKLGLQLASINPSATPIWPPTGFAIAAVLLWGEQVWPAIFIGAFAANATTAGTLLTSFFIAGGNTLEGVIGGYLVGLLEDRRQVFTTPLGVARFALFSAGAATLVSASIGVATLGIAGLAPSAQFGSIFLTWWLGDAAGALVVTPVIVLWAAVKPRAIRRRELIDSGLVFATTIVVGLVAFTPVLQAWITRGPLGFLCVVPLVWAALRRGPRDTATVSLMLCGFAVLGTLAYGGPFGPAPLNESFLLLLMFMIGVSLPSLALSADVAVRRRTEEHLRHTFAALDQRVQERTAALAQANRALAQANDAFVDANAALAQANRALGETNRALASQVEQRARAEADLREQSLHLREAQRLANLGSWDWDVVRNEVTWSDQLFDIYGLATGAFTGTIDDFIERLHVDDRERVRGQIGASLKSGRGFRDEERIVRPDGEVRHLQTTGEVVKDENGNVVRMLGICLDVTERKNAENALQDAREQLAQAQKLEALGQLTGGIAHDFNNLLMIVSGHAQLMRKRLSEPRDKQAIEAIHAAANRGEKLTRQLLAFSRRQRLTPVVVDLRQRIEAVREMLSASLRGNIELVVDVEDKVWPVEVDLGELELALVNIAVNARDAMPQGGRITLAARNVVLKPGSAAGSLDGDYVALAIIDTGDGIPPDVLSKIFEPFFTTKPVGKGTGLGLSQVHGFAHQSGGAVTVNSEPGQGTVVTIYLPRCPAQTAADTADPHVSAESAEGTILVVEDSREVAEVTTTLLEQLGYRVVRAENAAEALRHLQQGVEVDLMLSDIVMPGGMNGIDLAEACKERYPGIPVLLTSGYSEAAREAEDRFVILRKPFELGALEAALRSELRRGVRAARTLN